MSLFVIIIINNCFKVKFIIRLLIFISISSQTFSQKLTVSGYMKDAQNGEGLIGATVYVKELQNGTATNPYGFYSITLQPGSYHFVFSYAGYQSVDKEFTLDKENLNVNLELQPEITELEEVIIFSENASDNIRNIEMSTNKVDIATR